MIPRSGRGSHLYAADPHWWHFHEPEVSRHWDGKCWSQDRNWDAKHPELPGIELLKLEMAGGLNTKPGTINNGGRGSSGYQAINLAYHLGATKILLIGYDMQWTDGKHHWFGSHPNEVSKNQAEPTQFIGTFSTIHPAQYGIEIINCSRATALTVFPRATIDDF